MSCICLVILCFVGHVDSVDNCVDIFCQVLCHVMSLITIVIMLLV